MSTRIEYLAAVNHPGAYMAVSWTSTVKPATASKDRVLTKHVTAVVRTGVAYANLAVNADRETGPLPWGEWALYPYIITHKGAEYARLYVSEGTVRAQWFVDGQSVSRETFQSHLTPSARDKKRPVGGTITVKLPNVTIRVRETLEDALAAGEAMVA